MFDGGLGSAACQHRQSFSVSTKGLLGVSTQNSNKKPLTHTGSTFLDSFETIQSLNVLVIKTKVLPLFDSKPKKKSLNIRFILHKLYLLESEQHSLDTFTMFDINLHFVYLCIIRY